MPNNYIQTLTVDGTTYGLKDNISGYVTTDEKLKVDGAVDDTTYYPVLSTYDTTASTKHVSPGLSYSSSSQGEAYLLIGSNDLVGKLLIGAANGYPYRAVIQPSTLTANQYITLPDASGTVALTNKTFGISGDAREGSCLYVGTSSPYTPNLQLKRQNASMLNLEVRDDGFLKLQSVPYVDGEDDWSNASVLWNVDMARLQTIASAISNVQARTLASAVSHASGTNYTYDINPTKISEAGTIIGIVNVTWTVNTAGRRWAQVRLWDHSTSTGSGIGVETIAAPATGGATSVMLPFIYHHAQPTTTINYYVQVNQNSGSALTTTIYTRYILIPD